MTIASEISALGTNLAAAKNAVTTKGGTVGDTGLAGLASEIATIPSGGSLANYGTITYLDGNNVEQTITIATEDDFIELTLTGSATDIKINNTTINSDNITSVTVADGVQYLPNKFCGNCRNLATATLPSSIHFIGDGVLSYCSITNQLNLENVKFIGDTFFNSNKTFNQPLSLPSVDRIGDSFLQGCEAFNSNISLNADIKSIGQSFLRACIAYTQSFTIPANLERVIPTYFFYGANSFTGPLVCNSSLIPSSTPNNYLSTTSSTANMYTTGITLTGPYAQAWKDALPDRTSSPYRKLIVAS